MNKIIQGDCLEVMKTLEDNSIDLTVTSPPYDSLRTYNGFSWDFEWVAKELYRITKKGGVVVWVVGDQTVKWSESWTSFKQALYFKECGFNLHDTMIWIKEQLAFPDKNRYYNAFEYMFVFSKWKPNTFNPIEDKKNRAYWRFVDNSGERKKDGSIRKERSCAGQAIKEYWVRWNYWLLFNQSRWEHSKHPATFPEKLAEDHILSWSNEWDTVLDCFAGSGTTLKMAHKNNRKYIGIEISEEYINIIKQRLWNPQ